MSIAIEIAIFIAFYLICAYVYKFYSRVKLYPRGPMPLPVIGNCLMLFTNLDRHPSYYFQRIARQYGDKCTFWFGTHPIVIISGISLAKEVFSKYDFSDRCGPAIESGISEMFVGGHKTLAFMNVSDEFKLLRALSEQSIRKYLSTDKISKITDDIVKQTVCIIKEKECENSFVPFRYINSIFIRVLTQSIFGKRIAFDDQLIEQIPPFFESLQKNFTRIYICDFMPILKYVFNSTELKTSKLNDGINKTFELWYKDMVKQTSSLDNNLCGNVFEALNMAANSTRAKNKTEILKDTNMIGVLLTMILAASISSVYTFNWILLLMAYYPEMQQKMRNEINDNIGNNKIADLSDKEKCVYVNAFICETLRYRNVVPLAIPHLTSCHTRLGEFSIPKGTTILINKMSILIDSRYWKNPEVFNPQRFINFEQNLVAADMAPYIPFSTGKRMCVGDKFATNMLFSVLASLLQATNGSMFVLADKQSIDFEPINFGVMMQSKEYKIVLSNDITD